MLSVVYNTIEVISALEFSATARYLQPQISSDPMKGKGG